MMPKLNVTQDLKDAATVNLCIEAERNSDSTCFEELSLSKQFVLSVKFCCDATVAVLLYYMYVHCIYCPNSNSNNLSEEFSACCAR